MIRDDDGDAEAAAPPPPLDVAVIGGGPAGASAALALARLGARVALVDRGVARPRLGEGLPPAAAPLLQGLGVWADPEAAGHRRSPGIRSRWGGPEVAEVDFVRQPHGTGWQLDRGRFDADLARSARAAGALWLGGARVRGLERAARGRWRLALDHPEGARALDAAALVDASGRARWAARALGARVLSYDRLVATIATYAPGAGGEDPDARTVVEAVPEGWWYAAPLPDGRLVVAHLSDADLAARPRALAGGGWEAAVRATTDIGARVARRGGCLEDGPRRVGADSSRLETACGAGWWAVGDAAAAHDPLSSRGLLLAVEAGPRVAWAIAGREDGTDTYAGWVARAYARYLAQWLGYYAVERRWPTAPFWRRRHAAWARVTQS